MPFNSGFQLGLELTNVVAPLTGVVSRVCNLAVADALKRSGSDIITETKLAALIGRHRIDAAIKAHFKNCVTPSNQIAISRYVDIALHSGAGPTVKEALREGNPALFSMVVQMSLLSFACHEESLAFGMCTGIESMLEIAGNESERS